MLHQGYSWNLPLNDGESTVIVGNWCPAWSQSNTRTPGQRRTMRKQRARQRGSRQKMGIPQKFVLGDEEKRV